MYTVVLCVATAFASSLKAPSYLSAEEIPFYMDPGSTFSSEQMVWPPVLTPNYETFTKLNPGFHQCALQLAQRMRELTWTAAESAFVFAQTVLPSECQPTPRHRLNLLYCVSCHMSPGYPIICERFEQVKGIPDLDLKLQMHMISTALLGWEERHEVPFPG